MPPYPKHSLILFDWDGCTAIIESSRVQCRGKRVLSKSSRGSLSFEGRLHKVEILELSEPKEDLENYDANWVQTHRAIAISNEKEKRQNTRGRNKMGGYLDIWNDPEAVSFDNRSDEPEAERSDLEGRTVHTRSVKEGSNGRKITVFFEGLAESSDADVSPKRSPMYLDDLTNDEQEIVVRQVLYHQQGKISSSAQTDKVIIIQDEREILDLISDSKVQKKEVSTQTSDSHTLKVTGPKSETKGMQTSICEHQDDYAWRMEQKMD